MRERERERKNESYDGDRAKFVLINTFIVYAAASPASSQILSLLMMKSFFRIYSLIDIPGELGRRWNNRNENGKAAGKQSTAADVKCKNYSVFMNFAIRVVAITTELRQLMLAVWLQINTYISIKALKICEPGQ